MKQSIIALLAVSLWGGLVSGCGHKLPAECKQCETLPPDEVLTLKAATTILKADIWKGGRLPDYRYAHSEAAPATLAGLLRNTAGISVEEGAEIGALVLYNNRPFTAAQNMADESSINGISIYLLSDNKLRHRFFLKQADGRYAVVPELNCEAKSLATGDVADIAFLHWGDDANHYCAWAIVDKSILFKPNTNKENSLRYNVRYLMRKKKETSLRPRLPDDGKCPPPCTGANPNCENTIHGFSCDHTTDVEEEQQQASYGVSAGMFDQAEADAAYNITLHYLLRDSLLANYAVGRKYIHYYYNLTGNAYLTSDIVAGTAALLQKFNPRIAQLIDYPHNGSAILIDDDLRQETLALLQRYKAKAPNATEAGYIADVEADINKYSGKTIGEIIALL